MELRQSCGNLFGLLLILGVFAPVMSVPIMGGVSLSNGANGYLLIAMGLLALVIVNSQEWKAVWLPALVSAGVVGYTFFTYFQMKSEMKKGMADLEGNPFAGLASLAVESIRLDWGAFILAVASLGLLVVADNGTWNRGGE